MTKRLIYIVILFHSFVLFAQNRLPVQKGYITVVTGQKMEFINLKFQDDQVVFINVATRSEFTYFLNSVKRIEDIDKKVIYQKEDAVKSDGLVVNTLDDQVLTKEIPVVKVEKDYLMFRGYSKIYLNDNKLTPEEVKDVLKINSNALKNYKNGRLLNALGDVSIGLSIGLIVGGGISNMNKTSEVDYDGSTASKGSPIPIIAGIFVGLASVPLKITGRGRVKQAIANFNDYKRTQITEKLKTNYEFYAKVNGNGIGLALQW